MTTVGTPGNGPTIEEVAAELERAAAQNSRLAGMLPPEAVLTIEAARLQALATLALAREVAFVGNLLESIVHGDGWLHAVTDPQPQER